MGRRVGGAEAGGAGGHGLPYDRGHPLDLLRGGLPLLGGIAHHVAAQGTVPDVEGSVDADLAAHGLEELWEALEAVHGDALEGTGVHPLHPGEELDEPGGVAGLERSHGEPAVAGHHGGHAVIAARRAVRLEGELGVVVGVRVDDAWGHDPSGGVDHLGAVARVDEPDGGDAAVTDADIGGAAGQARSVHDRAVGDHQVEGRHT